MRGMESGLGCGEDRLSPLPFILRYSLADDTDSSLLSKLSSFLLVTSVMASVLTTPSGAHATKCAAGLHNPHLAFLLEFFFFVFFFVKSGSGAKWELCEYEKNASQQCLLLLLPFLF